MERIIITGALGQLGREFIKFFNKNNTYVLATDIRSPLEDLSCDFEIADAMDEKRIDYLIKKNNINVVYHLVAVLSANGEKNPFMALEINMKSFQNIISLSINNGIKKIFWPSSIAVFGTKSNLSFAAQDSILNPETIYGIAKLAGERLINYYNKKFDLDIRSLRYPGIISFNTKPGGGTTDYIIEMIQALKNGKDYTCFLNKNTELPMLYIDDAVKGTIEYMSVNKHDLNIKDSYNITGFSITPDKLEKKLIELGCSAKVIYKSDFRQDIADTWPKKIDDSSAKNDWNWKFKYGLKETLSVVFK